MKKQIISIALAAITASAALTACGRRSFDVTKTMEVNFKGSDGYGECEIENEYGWISDVQDYYSKAKSVTSEQIEQIEYALEMTVDYDIEPSENLSNGDTVTITPKIDSLADDYAFDLVGEPVTVTVEGLEKVEEFDPFEGVKVSFDGISPNGSVVISSEQSDITFTADKSSGLSNGDKVTVTAEPSYGMSEYAAEHGKVFSKTENEYTVEGLASYAMKLDDIPDETKDKMKSQSNDSITASAATWAEGNSLKKSEFLGYYFLTPKDGFSTSNCNILYCVYKNTSSVTGVKAGANSDTKAETGEETYYTYCRFENIMVLPDGTCSVNLSGVEMPSPYSTTVKSAYGKYSWGSVSFYTYTGYADLDSMFNDCVTKNIAEYAYENTVEQ